MQGRAATLGWVACVVLGVAMATQAGPGSAPLPRPDGYVNDQASVFDAEQKRYLENYLRGLERDTSAEVVVATVRSLDGLTVEEYATRLFAAWGIGKARDDNGVLVAPSERRVRIEVGYGLEPILPDGLAGEIIRSDILPEFRAGNVPRGIGRGLDRISRLVRGDITATSQREPAPSRDDPGLPLLLFIVPGVVGVAALTLTFGRRRPAGDRSPDDAEHQRDPSSSSGSSDGGGSDSSSSDFGGGSSGGGGASGSW